MKKISKMLKIRALGEIYSMVAILGGAIFGYISMGILGMGFGIFFGVIARYAIRRTIFSV